MYHVECKRAGKVVKTGIYRGKDALHAINRMERDMALRSLRVSYGEYAVLWTGYEFCARLVG